MLIATLGAFTARKCELPASRIDNYRLFLCWCADVEIGVIVSKTGITIDWYNVLLKSRLNCLSKTQQDCHQNYCNFTYRPHLYDYKKELNIFPLAVTSKTILSLKQEYLANYRGILSGRLV